MRKPLTIVLLFISTITFSQDTDVLVLKQEDTSATAKVLANTQRFIDSMKNVQANRDAMQGINNLMIYQNEQRAKQKKQAILYLTIGLFFLVILIVGMRRRTKK